MAQLRLDYVNSFIDARGKLRHSFRRKGFKRETIKGTPGSSEFMARYAELLAKTGGDAAPVDRDAPGSIDRVASDYLRDPVFTKGLAKATQAMRRAILTRFRDHQTPSGRRYGDNQLSTLPTERIKDAIKGLSPNAQKNYLKTLRHFMAYAIDKQFIAVDPTASIKASKPPKSSGHMTWLDAQIDQYRNHHALGTVPRLALELALNVAARRHDCHLLGRQHLKGGALTWKPHKTARITGKALTVKVLPELQAALDAIPRNDAMAFIVNSNGQPFKSAAAFGNSFADWCRQAGLKPVTCDDGRVRSYRIHGLRKSACRALAHAGCTGPEIMAVSGHSSLAQVQVYLDAVEQERMAGSAMDKRAASR